MQNQPPKKEALNKDVDFKAVGGKTKGFISEFKDFATKGITSDKISDFIIYAIENGRVVGIQGTRSVYEVIYEGKLQRVAISIGSNGFIVGANPSSIQKGGE